MVKEKLEAQARVIAEKLDDENGLWFHYKAVKLLGFQTCYELCSLALDKFRRGQLRTSPARYFNGCVTREIRERGGI